MNKALATYHTLFPTSCCHNSYMFYLLHSAARVAHVLTDKTYNYYGNSLCADGRKCLKDITPIEINKICKACNKGKQACVLVWDM